jgi:ribonucleoside-diphosphate reductase alpha chain
MAFRNSFGDTIFKQKYANTPDQTWEEKADLIVHDVTENLMQKEDQETLAQFIKNCQFMPGGRYIYYAGRQARFYNNCGVADTKLLTREGWVAFGDLDEDQPLEVLSPVDGKYYPARMHFHGTQRVNKITFAPLRGRSEVRYEVKFTRQHHWPLVGGGDTYDLRVGDVVPANSFSAGHDPLGFVHGFMFGDGCADGRLRLCRGKHQHLDALTDITHTLTYPDSNQGDPSLYYGTGQPWKELPNPMSDPEYISSFVKGWLAADGSTTCRRLSNISKENLEWFVDHAAFAGIVVTGQIRSQVRDVEIGEYKYNDHEIFFVSYQEGARWAGFKVESIADVGWEPVYCPFEPVHNRIVIDHNIDTYQCYLLRGEEDTREEWGRLLRRSSDCLMSGGGIGADYSVFRPEGSPLGRTGGIASGPIPLMCSANEVGRNVMQGGSRRSAIYASLNWRHGDAERFLALKNWDTEVAPGVTLRDCKSFNFNHPAPLDMTNISLNYDNVFLDHISQGHLPQLFIDNCKQAMMTGEPGFSFNFGDKENETLRNACTEVTSEDDSDVCNLGSINMGAVQDLDEFRSVCRLGAGFLVCGTITAELPYEKVYAVRKKNRRLGLGLMGIHEWLLQRGYEYGMNPELRQWLEVYREESERAANSLCDRLSISRPVAYRAIAPTGTIGILAGTTTGIEPLYAVAYKRRYLVGGDKWKYEYVVDSTAEELIQRYDLKANQIETSMSLVGDFERRLSFQADVQDYVDMAISSTINMPAWGSDKNNEDTVLDFSRVLAEYAPRLRGFTVYPDGARGGQPLTPCSYAEAKRHKGVVFEENSDAACSGGVCGI